MNPKKNNVRYTRRIPAQWVEKMDVYLEGLRARVEPADVAVKVPVAFKASMAIDAVMEPVAPVAAPIKTPVAAAILVGQLPSREGRAPLLRPGQKK